MNFIRISILISFVFSITSLAQAELNPLLSKAMKYDAVIVERVVSVDTVLIAGNEQIKLIGIQGPRSPRRRDVKRDANGFIIHDDDPTTPFVQTAFRVTKELLEGRTVRIEFDVERRNDDGVLLAYVFLPDGRMANLEILRQGFAELKLRSPNLKYADKFRSAYQEARREMKGLQGQW